VSDKATGNIMPSLMLEEHNHAANAKRVVPLGLLDDGSDYSSFTAFDFINSTPIAVVLVHPTSGLAYSATAGGGGGGAGGNVTLVGAAVTLSVDVTNPALNTTIVGSTVTLNVDVTNPSLNVTAHNAETFTPATLSPTFTSKLVSDAPVQLVDINTDRKSILVQADWSNSHSVFVGNTTADLDLSGQELRAGGQYCDFGDGIYSGEIWGVLLNTATTETMTVRIWERD